MKFSCNTLVLKSALDIVGQAIDPRPFNPLLTCVKLECKEDKLLAIASNSTTAISTAIPVEVESDGAACLPYTFLKNVVSKIDKDCDINLAVDEEFNATITWKKGGFELKAIDPDEFPEFPEVEEDALVLSPEIFLSHLLFASRFASKDETKRILTGVKVEAVDGRLTAIATDGHRLGVSSGDADIQDFSLIIPGHIVPILKAASDGDIEIKSNSSQMSFKSGDSQISVRALEGQYPDCLQMIPSDFEHEIAMNGKELKAAIDRVMLADDGKWVLIIRFGEGILAKVENSPTNQDKRASEDVVSSVVPVAMTIGIHAPYLVPALPDGEFIFCVNSPDKPVVIREKDSDRLALIMPIQIRN